ncbi:MAG: helix-turn-helix transcriptional regulator [Lachnospiraceae bacterium]|nr:helix-turn-helix transcriptional regulator [Lachnospiraceae bacterium]
MSIYGNIDMERSGKKMKELITQAGHDVKSIQKYLQLSCPQPVYRWFKGQILPTVDHLFMLSKLLGIHMEDFLVEKEESRLKADFPAKEDFFIHTDLALERIENDPASAERRMLLYRQLAAC